MIYEILSHKHFNNVTRGIGALLNTMIYEILSHKHFNNVTRGIGALLFCGFSLYFVMNYDKIMQTPAGKLQEIREAAEERDRELRILAAKGVFFVNKMPDLPPVSFEEDEDWETFAKKIASPPPPPQEEPKHAPRIEKGKSGDFVAKRFVVDHLRLDSGKTKRGDTDIDVPHIHALMSHIDKEGTQPFVGARVDILFMDDKDNILLRRSVDPLVVSGGLFGDKKKPLSPGESREFIVDATHPPSGWTDKLKAEVIYYQYARNHASSAAR